MLAIAYGGNAAMRKLRPQAQNLRRALGVVVALTALAIAFNLDRARANRCARLREGDPGSDQRSDRAERELARVRGATRETSAGLRDYGPAPGFTGIGQWINTPDEQPLSLAGLRGKVVLVDFWTYSCINCLRTLPHLRAWDKTYRSQGLTIVGVHTPEFAFEHVEDNVRGAVDRLDLDYSVAMDNDFGTWNATPSRTATGRRSTSSTRAATFAMRISAKAPTTRPSRTSAPCSPSARATYPHRCGSPIARPRRATRPRRTSATSDSRQSSSPATRSLPTSPPPTGSRDVRSRSTRSPTRVR